MVAGFDVLSLGGRDANWGFKVDIDFGSARGCLKVSISRILVFVKVFE